MRVLAVGSGGREHALAWAIAKSEDCDALFCAPGNAGTALLLAETRLGENLAVGAEDIGAEALPTFAILDENLVIRDIWTSEPSCAELAERIGGHAGG